MTDNAAFDEIFGDVPLMAILRGMGPERSLAVATTAWDLGIGVVESRCRPRPTSRRCGWSPTPPASAG